MTSDPLVGQLVDGRYEVIRRVARGGMATVYEALDTRLDRIVALKVMHRHLAEDPEFVERFRREARAAARLSHPHVVAVHDQGDDAELVYLAMEFVPGRTLRDVLRRFGPLTPEQALVILDPVLEALDAAHAAGFVHRDIKPENVLIADDGRVKVADFGLARALATSSTNATTGIIIGTVAYLSPEQVERGEADARSDVYAAGILLYEMVTNTVPHDGETPLSVAYQHVHADVSPPSAARPGIPAEVDALVLRATRRDPSLRYASAREFRADVRRVRNGLPAPRPLAADAAATVVVQRSEMTASPTTRPTTLLSDDLGDRQPAAVPRRRTPFIVAIVALAVALAAFGGWALATQLGRVPAPSVIGLTLAEATAQLAAEGLTVSEESQEFSEEVEAGRILRTDPAPGEGVAEGGALAAVVSKGPERYEVPLVRGQSPEQASAAITAANLSTGPLERVFDDTVPSGAVAGTEPAAGEPLRAGDAVTVLVSKGPEPVPVVDVTGRKVTPATNALERDGLIVQTQERFSMKVPEGVVIAVTPAPGTVVDSGSTVRLVVSKGPPPVEVPNVVDLRKRQAIAALEAVGLRVRVEEGAVTPLNRVLSQVPAAGETVPKGSVVLIRII